MRNLIGSSKTGSARAAIILRTAFIAGSVEIAAALLLYCLLISNGTVVLMLQSIASMVFGKASFSGGWITAIYGVAIYYLLSFAFTAFYFYVFPYFSFCTSQKVVSGLLYGFTVWLVMTFLILPVSPFYATSFDSKSAFAAIFVVMLFFGLPVSLMMHRFYNIETPSRVTEIYALH